MERCCGSSRLTSDCSSSTCTSNRFSRRPSQCGWTAASATDAGAGCLGDRGRRGRRVPDTTLYVDRSRNPVDLRHASAQDLLPPFRGSFPSDHPGPFGYRQSSARETRSSEFGSRPLFLVSRDVVSDHLRPTCFTGLRSETAGPKVFQALATEPTNGLFADNTTLQGFSTLSPACWSSKQELSSR